MNRAIPPLQVKHVRVTIGTMEQFRGTMVAHPNSFETPIEMVQSNWFDCTIEVHSNGFEVQSKSFELCQLYSAWWACSTLQTYGKEKQPTVYTRIRNEIIEYNSNLFLLDNRSPKTPIRAWSAHRSARTTCSKEETENLGFFKPNVKLINLPTKT